MGKKYDAYAKAAQAETQAKDRLHQVNGGSTEKAMTEATNNAKSAEVVANVLYNEWMEDPTG